MTKVRQCGPCLDEGCPIERFVKVLGLQTTLGTLGVATRTAARGAGRRLLEPAAR